MKNEFIQYFLEDKINLSAACCKCLNWNRYKGESYLIHTLALYSLNKEKNKVKGKFEDIELFEVLGILLGEVKELEDEISNFRRDKPNINFERVLEEIADVAASLTGVLVKVLKLYQESKK